MASGRFFGNGSALKAVRVESSRRTSFFMVGF
jgi:hypothetical protein